MAGESKGETRRKGDGIGEWEVKRKRTQAVAKGVLGKGGFSMLGVVNLVRCGGGVVAGEDCKCVGGLLGA